MASTTRRRRADMAASGLTLRVLAVLAAFGLTGCLVEASDSAGDPDVDSQAIPGDELPFEAGEGLEPIILPTGGHATAGELGETGGPTPDPWDEMEGPTPDPWRGPTPDPW